MVAEICKIYINLCHNDDFCQAISSDERSYSAELLPKATATLIKISQPPDMIQKFEDLTVKIQVDVQLINLTCLQVLFELVGT